MPSVSFIPSQSQIYAELRVGDNCFILMIFIFSVTAGLQCCVHFLLCSKVTQSHIHVYVLFSHILLRHEGLDIVPSATQQDLIASPFQRQ